MALPADINVITVTGTFQTLGGVNRAGYVIFDPGEVIYDSTGMVVLGGPESVTVSGGSFAITLPCTDNATLNPTNFGYAVTIAVPGCGGPPDTYQLPHTLGASVDLTELVPVNPPTPYSTIYGVLATANTWMAKQTFSSGIALPSGATTGDVWTATDTGGDGSWQAPQGGAPSGAAGGDLSGTYPDPSVAKVGGVAVSGTPSSGQVPVASSSSAAAWTTLTAASVGADASGAAAAAQAAAEAASLPLDGGTLTGYLAPAVSALTQSGGSVAVDASKGNAFNLTVSASGWTIANPMNPVDGQVIRFRLTQGTGGGFTWSWGTAFDFGAAGQPAWSSTAGQCDVAGFEYVASLAKWVYLGSALGN